MLQYTTVARCDNEIVRILTSHTREDILFAAGRPAIRNRRGRGVARQRHAETGIWRKLIEKYSGNGVFIHFTASTRAEIQRFNVLGEITFVVGRRGVARTLAGDRGRVAGYKREKETVLKGLKQSCDRD